MCPARVVDDRALTQGAAVLGVTLVEVGIVGADRVEAFEGSSSEWVPCRRRFGWLQQPRAGVVGDPPLRAGDR